MKKLYKYWSLALFIAVTFFIYGCNKNEVPSPEQEGSGVRLKHLTVVSQVATALGSHMQGYEVQREGSFTNSGQYPRLPYIYNYTVNFKQDIDGYVYAWRSVSAQTGMGKDTKEELLDQDSRLEEVNDPRLGKAPYENVFALRYRDNEKKDWVYELHMRLAHINNQDNHVVSISGTFGPTSNEEHEAIAPEPMEASAAISAMLELVEPID